MDKVFDLIRRLLKSRSSGTDQRPGIGLAAGERHYRAFVGPPENYDLVAAMQFNLMTALGLRETHSLLDIGCGSLRGGKLFIPYLLPGRYFGLEPEKWLIEEGIERECGRDLIRMKRPVFRYDRDYGLTRFNTRFDFILAQSIFTHAPQSQILRCLEEAAECMAPAAVFAASYIEGTEDHAGETWTYPQNVAYTFAGLSALAGKAGLDAHDLKWDHPNRAAWITFVPKGAATPGISGR